jgi:hypothetical protein
MPKLNKENAKKAENATSGFEPLDPGAYHVKLMNVDASREGPKGPYWSWEFEVVEPGEYTGRKLWNNTSLSDDAMFSFNQTFAAFDVPTDTDTDDIMGDVVKAIVSIRTIEQGARKGELANQIDRLVPAEEGFEVPAGAGGGESPNPDEVFE